MNLYDIYSNGFFPGVPNFDNVIQVGTIESVSDS